MILPAESSVYLLPVALALLVYLRQHRKLTRRGRKRLEVVTQEGLTEPPSLHPVIDPAICIGAAACVRACPEKAISVIDRKGVLTNPSHCIGHGACAASCPVGAISLVFGTERRGVDIPQVKPTFETNVPGIYIAGELGGMGLVGKSAEQGRQAVESIVASKRQGGELDLVIVGAGPAGLSAALTAKAEGLKYVIIEQEPALGGTVYHYPRNKVVMTHPLNLSLVGEAKLGEISKESLLEFWQGVIDQTGIEVIYGERMVGVEAAGEGFLVRTERGQFNTSNLLLALGRRGTPRKLGVPGEEHPKVVYRLVDPEQYRGQRVLVVGGGDSAIEAALALSEQPGTEVILSYRSEAFSRAKPKNRNAVMAAGEAGQLTVMLSSTVSSISAEAVVIAQGGEEREYPNDGVIVCAGGILPMAMLREMGVMVETKYGTA